MLKAPFPWFGGKSRVADIVWDRFGNTNNYVEPFAGSLAVLLSRPHPAQTETVNDLDCFLANFWRALALDPLAVAEHADWPVNEADLHARHLWLVNQVEFRERMKTDPDYFDAKIAGWWVWGISQWIGSGWCSRPEWTGRTNAGAAARGIFRGVHQKRPMIEADHNGRGVHRLPSRQLPSLRGDSGAAGMGVHRKLPSLGDKGRGVASSGNAGMGVNRQIPHLGDAGRGVEEADSTPGVTEKRPNLGGRGTGNGVHADAPQSALEDYMLALAARLRRVRVCCGDWTRVLGPSVTVKHGVCGVFLDPPYDMRVVSGTQSGRDGAAPSDGLYSSHDNDLSVAVRNWALENGDNPLLRIALCGYEGEHEFPNTWECVPWKAHGGYGSQRGDRGYKNAARERIWFSPHCRRQPSLFAAVE